MVHLKQLGRKTPADRVPAQSVGFEMTERVADLVGDVGQGDPITAHLANRVAPSEILIEGGGSFFFSDSVWTREPHN